MTPLLDTTRTAGPHSRERSSVPARVDGVVFVLRGERYPLSSGECATLDGYMRVPNLTLQRLRGKKEAGDSGAEILITDNEERGALRDSLDVASSDRRHLTEGMQRIREAAREPFTRPRVAPVDAAGGRNGPAA